MSPKTKLTKRQKAMQALYTPDKPYSLKDAIAALKKAPSISTTVRVRLSVGAGSVSGYELQIDATGLRMPLLTVAPILGLFPSLLPDTTFTVTVRSVSGRSREPDVGVGPGGVKGGLSSESTQVIFSKDYSTAILRATAPAPSTPTSSKSPSSTKKGTASSR